MDSLWIWRGEMSFVGLRPIRKHFAGMLEAKEPLYSLQFLAKPSLTGWGQVNNGYHNTVTGQLHRFRYDFIIYKNHLSGWTAYFRKNFFSGFEA